MLLLRYPIVVQNEGPVEKEGTDETVLTCVGSAVLMWWWTDHSIDLIS